MAIVKPLPEKTMETKRKRKKSEYGEHMTFERFDGLMWKAKSKEGSRLSPKRINVHYYKCASWGRKPCNCILGEEEKKEA